MGDFLTTLSVDFALAIAAADAKRPQAKSHRGDRVYQPGIGPHTESQTVDLVLGELRKHSPELYQQAKSSVPYPKLKRQRCDLMIPNGSENWFIEVKMMRLMGDNGKKNDNILMHILSPYSQDRSALTDCDKLLASGFEGHKAILIYGYDYSDWPLATAIFAFECLTERRAKLGPRAFSGFGGLIHPVHHSGGVYVWEVMSSID
jgi:hypothetical protein